MHDPRIDSMKNFITLTRMEFKLFLREPQAAFFTLVFPLIMLFAYGSVYGNKPNPLFGGYGNVDVSVPSYTALIIATSGLISITVIFSTYRETGILRRYKATPVRPLSLLTADVVVIFIMTSLGMFLLILAAKLFYGLRFAGNPVNLGLAFVLSCMSFFSFGFILAGLLPSARTAQIVGMALFFPMIFLSGSTIPVEMMPEKIRAISQFIPLTYVVRLMKGFWFGETWSQHTTDLAVLLVLMIVSLLVSTKVFRWE
ncbi:ABC transporter permease [Acidobacteriota bacterium]